MPRFGAGRLIQHIPHDFAYPTDIEAARHRLANAVLKTSRRQLWPFGEIALCAPMREPLISAASQSRPSLARAWHFASTGGMRSSTFEAVDGADAKADFSRHLADADALGQLLSRALDLVRLSARPAQFPTHLASLADEFAVAGELVPTTLSPARTRCWIIDRSNSPKAPVIWNSSLPVGVVVSMFCWSR